MRWLWRFVKRLLLWGFGLFALLIVMVKMFGPLQTDRLAELDRQHAAAEAKAAADAPPKPPDPPKVQNAQQKPPAPPKPASASPKPPPKPEPEPKRGETGLFAPNYLFADSDHVLVWRDDKAMSAGLRLIMDGVSKTRPDLVLENVTCLADVGSRVTVLKGGFFSSTVIVVDGRQSGCRGDVDNGFLSKSRTSAVR